MTPVHGTKLSKSWFTASTRKLESLLPFLSDKEADQVCDELNSRESVISANGGAENWGERDQLEYRHNEHIDY
jgi:hypothetical protein